MNDPFITNEFDLIRNASPDRDGLIVCSVVAMPNMVVFPGIITPVNIPEGRATAAIKAATVNRQTVIALLQLDPNDIDPTPDKLNFWGTEIAPGQMLPFPDNQKTALVQGRRRVEVVDIIQTDPYITVRARVLEASELYDDQTDALMQTVLSIFQNIGELSETLPDEVIDYALTIEDPGWLGDFIASTLSLSPEERQHVLELVDTDERLREVAIYLNRELNMMELRDEISGQIQQEMNRNQREMYLREQMRVIQTELGEEDIFQQELNEVRQQILDANLPKDIHERALKEASRLMMMPPMAPEVGIVRTYIDWIV
ncbi:MAG TPA: LON peptidase substrate-binding domain-containing protein, partial [Phototrophicaceae bacterium]|nr:LON peptidase substrate-binding domain-containing protein [Phototrophicaceae bacterium]